MRRFLITASTGLVLVGLACVLLPSLNWDGDVPRKVKLTVRDATTAAPVAGAGVRSGSRDVGTTDAVGRCEWTQMFGAGGTSGIFGRSGHWNVDGEVTIAGPGERRRTVQLRELVSPPRRPLRDSGPIELTVALPNVPSTTQARSATASSPSSSP
jgi:hypothetical protein